MKSLEIRKKFFDFFIKRGHEQVASSSLIPAQDPTLLFANAGMNQFKDVFLGKEKRSYTRAVSIQKCVRAGGKHNDLDNVGFTKRHLTFFEMMGNFSFGDYFKKDAIEFAWDFLTKEMNLPIEDLHATVYKTDDESYDLWHKHIGIPSARMHRLGEAENFWQMGDTGPCGPCTEIHIDRGPAFGCADITQCGPACNCDRFLEIWNLVFMQFDRQQDGTDKPLKQTGVDTGMGLERLCVVVQSVDSVYGTDLFAGILKKIEELTGVNYATQSFELKAAFHVLADHVRSASMIIADGGAPSNEGRGYVLRKIIRRAALFTKKLTDKNIFPELSRVVVKDFASIYPELITSESLIYKVLTSEIEKFSANLVRGQQFLEKFMAEHKADKNIPGSHVFKLYDTFGFPLELIIIMAQEKGYTVDQDGFEREMKRQQEQSGKKEAEEFVVGEFPENIKTVFTGYQELETPSKIIAIIHDKKFVTAVPARTTCWVIAEKTSLFGGGGGQVVDQGWLEVHGKNVAVRDVKKTNGTLALLVETPSELKVGDAVVSRVNKELRVTAMKNHTATHLLQSALITLFGKQIKQSGSLVAPDYLRFDFTYPENLSPEDIVRVEELVNQKIMENIPVSIEESTLKEATNRGVIAFFGEKYNPEKVRIVDVPGFSAELCGGTHVRATGDIGCFKITEMSSLSAGTRRIVAVTGPKALELFQQDFAIVKNLCQEFSIKPEAVLEAVHKVREQLKDAQLQLKSAKRQSGQASFTEWEKQKEAIGSLPFLFVNLTDVDDEDAKEIAAQLSVKVPGLVFVLNSAKDRSAYIARLSTPHAAMINLKDLATWLKDTQQLRGGGSPIAIQGTGTTVNQKLGIELKEWLSKNAQ
jgi:alanyl-tRNA synthetase